MFILTGRRICHLCKEEFLVEILKRRLKRQIAIPRVNSEIFEKKKLKLQIAILHVIWRLDSWTFYSPEFCFPISIVNALLLIKYSINNALLPNSNC